MLEILFKSRCHWLHPSSYTPSVVVGTDFQEKFPFRLEYQTFHVDKIIDIVIGLNLDHEALVKSLPYENTSQTKILFIDTQSFLLYKWGSINMWQENDS
jgi:hypothetical protein